MCSTWVAKDGFVAHVICAVLGWQRMDLLRKAYVLYLGGKGWICCARHMCSTWMAKDGFVAHVMCVVLGWQRMDLLRTAYV